MIDMKAILIDDESLALDFLESQLKKISDISVVHKFVEFKIDRDAKILNEIDVVFLDIEMPQMNGIQLAEKLLEIKPSLIIVFVTGFHEYAVQAFGLDSLDYILKPIQLNRLKITVNRIEKMLDYYRMKKISEKNHLQIKVCKELSFEIAGDNPEIVHFRTAKAQELFLYLLLHNGETLLKSELADLLKLGEHDYSQLYTTIYHIRKTLNQFCQYILLENVKDGYRLTLNNVAIDIVEWENSILSAPPVSKDNINKYEEIMKLYTGPYLQEYNYFWAEAERKRLEELWLKSAHQIAGFYLYYNYLENAEKWYSKIYKLTPANEKANFSLMNIYDRFGYGVLVDHQFNQYKSTLIELGLEVEPHIQNWYEQWIRNKKRSDHKSKSLKGV